MCAVVASASDGVQVVGPEVPRDASLDGDGKGIVTRPEGDDGVAGGGLGEDVRRGLC